MVSSSCLISSSAEELLLVGDGAFMADAVLMMRVAEALEEIR